jgi:predicted DNA-binding transcriptional regulator AlpA
MTKASNFARAKVASAYFQIAVSTLWLWTKSRPGFPQPMHAGARVTLFDLDAIETYLKVQSAKVS